MQDGLPPPVRLGTCKRSSQPFFFSWFLQAGPRLLVPSSSSLTSQWESRDFHQGALGTWRLELTPASIWNHRPSESLGCPPG